MIDLNKIVNETLVKLEEEKFVETVVKKRLEQTISEIVDDTFRKWSTFGENLKSYIEENLNVNIENLGIEGYNTLALKAIQEELDKVITAQGIEKIKESTREILSDVKSEYTLSEIIESLKEENSKEEYEFDEDDTIAIIIDGEDDGYKHIYLSVEEPTSIYRTVSKYDYDYQIDINKEGKPYSIKLKNKEIDTKKILGGLYGLDKLLFKIYSSGAKIILDKGMDPEDYDIYYRTDY